MEKNATHEENQHSHTFLMTHNVFIVWQPEYNLGIPIIDEQHRGIVTTINSLYFGMQNKCVGSMLSSIVDMMNDYTHIHFQIEENFLEMLDYPHAKVHHALHADLSRQLTSTGRKSLLTKDPYQFMNFLKDWWISHICHEDLIFRDFFMRRAKRP